MTLLTVVFAPSFVHDPPSLAAFVVDTMVVVVVVVVAVAASAIFNVPRFRVYVSPVLEALNA